jgi:glycosyltransferase involved in cell wall biosynthesis
MTMPAGTSRAANRRPNLRVLLDARPLQAPARNPTTATYLDHLLGAFAELAATGEVTPAADATAPRVADDSFLFLLDTPGPDPSPRYPGLPFAGRRRLPPTRRLRAATLMLDPFLLRAAALGTTLGITGSGGTKAVFHATGGTLPIASGAPMVVTLLDLAAWELPAVYQRSPAERFGQRLRVRLLRQAERLIVASEATARAASRFLPFPRERIHVIPLAPTLPRGNAAAGDAAGDAAAEDAHDAVAVLRERLGLPDRYLLFRAQFDARKDLSTLLRAVAVAASRGGAAPPDVVIDLPNTGMDDAGEGHAGDGAAVAKLIQRHGVADRVRVLPSLPLDDEATLLAGTRALVHPVLVEGSGLAIIDALAAGVPVVATNVGAVGELVGKAGILVPARDPDRLAAALATIWADDRVHARLARAARGRPSASRTWTDVALETQSVYALTALRARA